MYCSAALCNAYKKAVASNAQNRSPSQKEESIGAHSALALKSAAKRYPVSQVASAMMTVSIESYLCEKKPTLSTYAAKKTAQHMIQMSPGFRVSPALVTIR